MHVFALISDCYLWSERFGLKLLVSLWENCLFTNLACVGLQIIGRVKADPDFLPRLSVSSHLFLGIRYKTQECPFRCGLNVLRCVPLFSTLADFDEMFCHLLPVRRILV